MKVTKSVDLCQQFKSLKHSIQKDMRKAYWEYINSLICVDTANSDYFKQPKKFWSYMKSLQKDSTGIPCLKTNGHMVTDNLSKAKILNAQFQSVFTIEDLTTFPKKGPSQYPSIPDVTITSNGIAQLLSGLDVHKAPGPDSIGPLVLKELYDILPYFGDNFQCVFEESFCSPRLETCKCHTYI